MTAHHRNIQDLIEQELGVRVSVDDVADDVTMATAVTEIIRRDPQRVSIIFVNTGATPVFIGFHEDVSSTNGFRLPPSGGVLAFNWREDLTMPAQSWFGVVAAGSSTLKVFSARIL